MKFHSVEIMCTPHGREHKCESYYVDCQIAVKGVWQSTLIHFKGKRDSGNPKRHHYLCPNCMMQTKTLMNYLIGRGEQLRKMS